MKLKIDLTDPRHIAAAAAFFNSLAGVVQGETLTIEPETKPARRTRATKPKAPVIGEEISEQAKKATGAELKEGEAVAINEAGEMTAATQGEASAEGEVTLKTLQNLVPLLSKASKDNIPLMRDKLIELGAKRVSSLTSDKYQEFYDFLKTLDNAGA